MFKKVLIVLTAIIGVILLVAVFQPSTFRVSRSTVVAAPASILFAEVNDFHRWQAWSPYEKIDPAMQRTFEGAAAGVGATYGWAGNNAIGAGRMTIVESRPPEFIRIKMEFFKPMAGVAEAAFTFVPENGRTRVTWTMDGNNNYIAKVFCLFMNMDKMVGGQFEQGLAELKARAESPAPAK